MMRNLPRGKCRFVGLASEESPLGAVYSSREEGGGEKRKKGGCVEEEAAQYDSFGYIYTAIHFCTVLCARVQVRISTCLVEYL